MHRRSVGAGARLARSTFCIRPNSHKGDRVGLFDPGDLSGKSGSLSAPPPMNPAHPVVRRGSSKRASASGCRGSRTSPSLQHAFLCYTIFDDAVTCHNPGDITHVSEDYFILMLAPFWAMFCCSPGTSHANLLLAMSFGVFRHA